MESTKNSTAAEACTTEKLDLVALEAGTTFKSPKGYLVTVERIWVTMIHFPAPATMIEYSYIPLVPGNGRSGRESNTVAHFVKHIMEYSFH